MKNIFFIFISLLFTSLLQAQTSVNSFEIADLHDGELEVLLNKSYNDSIKKANKINIATLLKKNKKELNKIEFEDIVADIDLFLLNIKIVDSAKTYLGVPYRYGGMSSNGIDCSALILNAFHKNNYELPRTSFAQSKLGKKMKKNKSDIGDLIFFKTTKRGIVSHVGIIVENVNGSIKFIHASSSRGVTISSLDSETYFKKRFAKIKRIIG